MRFEVQTKTGRRADRIASIVPPGNYPSFILNFNNGWNDYGYSNWFALFYANKPNETVFIGEVKLMCNKGNVMDYLPKEFEYLDDTFCSLAITQGYYQFFHDRFEHIYALEVMKEKIGK